MSSVSVPASMNNSGRNSNSQPRQQSQKQLPSKNSSPGKTLEDRLFRYTPVLAHEPPNFVDAGYSLHFAYQEPGPRIAICVTLYNEDPEALESTLAGIGANLEHLIKQTSDPEFWKDVVICLVVDGFASINPLTLEYLIENRLCSPTFMEQAEAKYEEEIAVHLFQNTIQIQQCATSLKKFPPMQVALVLKKRNAGKLHSHWWYFGGICEYLQPDYCFLLDAGTIPNRTAFWHLFKELESDSDVAGVAGEITPLRYANCHAPLVAVQQLEYKLSNILYKTTESVFGYISVLPGAFSAYRFDALQGSPLNKYLHHIITPLKEQKPFSSNMYLAEDRILCYELIAKANCHYVLRYVHSAKARTDVPTDLPSLIKQRRRWLNGSIFSLLYAIGGLGRIMSDTLHSTSRKSFLMFEFFMFIISIAFQWFSISNIYLSFFFLINLVAPGTWFVILRYLFISLLLVQFILGLGNKPSEAASTYYLSSWLFAFFTVCILLFSVTEIINGSLGFVVLASLTITFGVLILVSFLYGALFPLATCFVWYTLYSATYTVILPVYSLCNLHDISWGTKNLEDVSLTAKAALFTKHKLSQEQVEAKLRRVKLQNDENKSIAALKEAEFRTYRSHVVLLWIFSNGLYVSIMTGLQTSEVVVDTYINAVFLSIVVFYVYYGFGAITYYLFRIRNVVTRHGNYRYSNRRRPRLQV